MASFIADLVIFLWFSVTLVVAFVVQLAARGLGASKTWRPFGWTMLATWVVVPVGLKSYDSIETARRVKMIEAARGEYRDLCASISRTRINATASDVESIGIWPERGPRDAYGFDLFYSDRTGGVQAVLRYRDRRHGGYAQVIAIQPTAPLEAGPRYRVEFERMALDRGDDLPRINGVKIRITDRANNRVLAERVDYVAGSRFAFARGCDSASGGTSADWHRDNLEFIRKVLVPPPGVRTVRSELPALAPGALEAGVPDVLEASVVSESGWNGRHAAPILPPEILHHGYYRSDGPSTTLSGYRTTFATHEADFVVDQGLGIRAPLVAMIRIDNQYAAIFGINEHPPYERKYLLERRFDLQGGLLHQTRIRLPEQVDPAGYVGEYSAKFDYRRDSNAMQVSVLVTTHPKPGDVAKRSISRHYVIEYPYRERANQVGASSRAAP